MTQNLGNWTLANILLTFDVNGWVERATTKIDEKIVDSLTVKPKTKPTTSLKKSKRQMREDLPNRLAVEGVNTLDVLHFLWDFGAVRAHGRRLK